MKKFLSLFLVGTIFISCFTIPVNAKEGSNVKPDFQITFSQEDVSDLSPEQIEVLRGLALAELRNGTSVMPCAQICCERMNVTGRHVTTHVLSDRAGYCDLYDFVFKYCTNCGADWGVIHNYINTHKTSECYNYS